jgi:hypothetical protein
VFEPRVWTIGYQRLKSEALDDVMDELDATLVDVRAPRTRGRIDSTGSGAAHGLPY